MTYTIPVISQIRIDLHYEAHCNDFGCHFPWIDKQENEINCLHIIRHCINFFIKSKYNTVDENDEQDKAVEPRAHTHNLNELVSEWICHRHAA